MEYNRKELKYHEEKKLWKVCLHLERQLIHATCYKKASWCWMKKLEKQNAIVKTETNSISFQLWTTNYEKMLTNREKIWTK
jgi:hypothetical protein